MNTPLRITLVFAIFVASVPITELALADHSEFVTPHDTIPNFAENPTIVSAQTGPWSSASTWNPPRLPGPADIVLITHTVIYDTTEGNVDTIGIASPGVLHFSTAQNTRLRVGTLLVMPDGTLEIGSTSNPVPDDLSAEIIIRDLPLDSSADPGQYGTGVLSVDGIISLHGAVKSPTFVRAAAEPLAGASAIALEQAVSGWMPGDRIFIPDSRQVPKDDRFNWSYVLHIDEATVESVSPDGKSVKVSPALQYEHRGALDADGTRTVLADGTRLLPHVGNLTRNVVIRSENPSGTRGHTLFTHRSDVNIRYVQFQDLGRTRAEPLDSVTNKIGRYPLHMHHVWGPVNPSNTGYQFEVVGNAVNDSLKWPIAVHGSHYGLIRWNVVFGGSRLTGAGIAIEDGSETENLFEENFVANIRGAVNPRNSGPSTADGTTPGSAAECFWAAGFNNRFVNNVASDCRNPAQQIVSGPCWKLIVQPATTFGGLNPRFRGADMTNTEETVTVNFQRQPVLEFRGNECYGGSADGLTLWHLGTSGYDMPEVSESVVKDFRVWHTYEGAIYNYPANHVTVDGLVHRIDRSQTHAPTAVLSGDYRHIDLTIRGGDIHAGSVFGSVEAPLGTIRIENVHATTRYHAFVFLTPATPGTRAGIPDPPGITVLMRNNIVEAWPGQNVRSIAMIYQDKSETHPNVRYEAFVHDYQGQPGNDFEVYWREQATQDIAGGLAPCNDTVSHPEVYGITCPLEGGNVTPPAAPSSLVLQSP